MLYTLGAKHASTPPDRNNQSTFFADKQAIAGN
jgi:hypothetical protein